MSMRSDERGQSAVLAVIFMTALIGMSAAVLDVGSWFRADRKAQATADAAALAGAQALPVNPAAARTLALDYAQRNGDSLAQSDVSVTSRTGPNDTIEVDFEKPAPGFFSRIFGISSVDVGASATARVFQPGEARWVAPIVVDFPQIDELSGPGCPCLGPENATVLPLGRTGAPGAFDLLNLHFDDPTGTVGTSELSAWIVNGYPDYLPLEDYFSAPGSPFRSVQGALQARYGTELLFPVTDRPPTGEGSNAVYHIVAWVGFHLVDSEVHGNTGSISGWFTNVIWDGLEAVSGGDPQFDLGVRSVQLVQ